MASRIAAVAGGIVVINRFQAGEFTRIHASKNEPDTCVILVLESVNDPSRRLCVATTHLYFHPAWTLVRLLQATVIVRYIEYIKNMYSTQGHKLSTVFCGDFNSTPDKAVVEFLTAQKINKEHSVWSDVEGKPLALDLHHNVRFGSACGFPAFTNFVPGFKECIDYIFYDMECLDVNSVVPLPEQELLDKQYVGIPGETAPSDHLPLICDLSWRS